MILVSGIANKKVPDTTVVASGTTKHNRGSTQSHSLPLLL